MKHFAVVVALATFGANEAIADHYMRTADPQVVGAINEIIQIMGQGCNQGNSASCNAIPMMQQQAHLMLSAGYDCQHQGNQQACTFYNQSYQQLEQAYFQVTSLAQNGGLMQNTGGGQGMGMTHEQRMAQLRNFSEQNTANFYNRQAQSDASHQAFLETIRQ